MFLELHKDELGRDPTLGYHKLNLDFPVPGGMDVSRLWKLLVVRNPYSRLVSAFINKYIGDTDSYVSTRQAFLRHGITLERHDFISYLRQIRSLRDNGLLNKIDIHTRQQTFDFDASDPMIFVVRLEKLKSGLVDFYSLVSKDRPELLDKVKAFLSSMTPENPTKYSKSDMRKASCVLFHKDSLWPHFTRMYDEEAKEIIKDVYGQDFEAFGYPTSLKSGKILMGDLY